MTVTKVLGDLGVSQPPGKEEKSTGYGCGKTWMGSKVEGEVSEEWISSSSGIFSKITLWGEGNSERLSVLPVRARFRFLFISAQGLRESFPAFKSKVLEGVWVDSRETPTLRGVPGTMEMMGRWGGVSTHSPGYQHSPGQEQEFIQLEQHPGIRLGSEPQGQKLLNSLCLWLRALGTAQGDTPHWIGGGGVVPYKPAHHSGHCADASQ